MISLIKCWFNESRSSGSSLIVIMSLTIFNNFEAAITEEARLWASRHSSSASTTRCRSMVLNYFLRPSERSNAELQKIPQLSAHFADKLFRTMGTETHPALGVGTLRLGNSLGLGLYSLRLWHVHCIQLKAAWMPSTSLFTNTCTQ